MDNLLVNASFENGWKDDQNRQIPNGWKFWYAPPTVENWIDPSEHSRFSAPEMVHLTRDKIPESEWDDFFFDHSATTLKIFAPKWRTMYCRLWQDVVLTAGKYRLTVNLNSDIVDHWEDGKKIAAPDPLSGQMWFAINERPGPWFPMTPFLQKHKYVHEFEVTVTSASFEIGAEWVCPHPLTGGNAIFTDAWTLERLDGPVIECEARAREPFDSVVNVFDPTWGKGEFLKVCVKVWDGYGAQDISPSTDKAFVGCGLGLKTARFWHVEEKERPAYEEFARKYYPKTNVKLEFMRGEPEPPPPPPHNELWSLHVQDWVEGALTLGKYKKAVDLELDFRKNFILRNKMLLPLEETAQIMEQCPVLPEDRCELWKRWLSARWQRHDLYAQAAGFTSRVKPEFTKLFIAEQARQFVEAGSKHVDLRFFRDGQYNIYAEDKAKEALRLAGTYKDSALANREYITCIEGTNEEPNNANAEKNRHVRDFEIALSRAHEKLGLPPLASPNTPTANLEYSDLDIFIPLVEELIRTNGYWTIHAYPPIEGNESLPESEWKWFDERLYWHLEYFAKRGLYPQVLITEWGPCGFIRKADGGFGGYLATQGWRNNNVFTGTIEQKRAKYFEVMRIRRARLLKINAEFRNIIRGVFAYTVAPEYCGWRDFWHKKDDLDALATFLVGLR